MRSCHSDGPGLLVEPQSMKRTAENRSRDFKNQGWNGCLSYVCSNPARGGTALLFITEHVGQYSACRSAR